MGCSGPFLKGRVAVELAAYDKMVREVLARQNRLSKNGNTYTSDRGAEFTIRVGGAELNCRKGFSRGYSSCGIEARYTVTTNYNGSNDPNVRVRCEVEVTYTEQDGSGGRKSEDDSKSFYVYGQSYGGRMDIDISFYEPAIRVSLMGCDV